MRTIGMQCDVCGKKEDGEPDGWIFVTAEPVGGPDAGLDVCGLECLRTVCPELAKRAEDAAREWEEAKERRAREALDEGMKKMGDLMGLDGPALQQAIESMAAVARGVRVQGVAP